LDELLRRDEWHARLINGSDYPLPGIMPLYSLRRLVARGLLDEAKAHFCAQLRVHNPLLADFVIKRHLAKDGRRFAASVFESARVMSPVVA
jgi:mannonate dehydratase